MLIPTVATITALLTAGFYLLEGLRMRRKTRLLDAIRYAASNNTIEEWLAEQEDRKMVFAFFCASFIVTPGATGTYRISEQGDIAHVWDADGKCIMEVHPTALDEAEQAPSPSTWKL